MSAPDTPPPDPGSPRPQPPDAEDQAYQAAPRSSPWGYVFFVGLFLFLAGWFQWKVDQELTPVLMVWLFLSAVGVLAPIAWHAVDLWNAVATRRGAAFGLVVLTTLLAVVVLVAVSVVNQRFRSKLPALDLTASRMYTLSGETEKVLEQVPGTIYATYLVYGPDVELRERAIEQLQVYESASRRFVLKVLEPLREPAETERYLATVGVRQTSSGERGDVLVLTYAEPEKEVAPGKQKEVPVEAYTWYGRSALGEQKWHGERLLTNAVMELVYRRYKLYVTGGHGERTVSEHFRFLRERIGAQNVEVAENPLVLSQTGRVPEDCDLLLVPDPQAAFTPIEAAAIRSWLEQGKTLFLLTDYREARQESGLEQILGDHGITAQPHWVVIGPKATPIPGGRVLFEYDTTLQIYPNSYTDHAAVRALSQGGGFSTVFHVSSYVEVEETPPEGVDPEVVVYSPSITAGSTTGVLTSIVRRSPDLGSGPTEEDRTGRFALLATSERVLATGPTEGPRRSRVIVSGDADVFSDLVARSVPTNLDLAIGLVQWGIGRSDLVAVSERTIEEQIAEVTAPRARQAFWWPLFVAILSLVAGGAVWWARRR